MGDMQFGDPAEYEKARHDEDESMCAIGLIMVSTLTSHDDVILSSFIWLIAGTSVGPFSRATA